MRSLSEQILLMFLILLFPLRFRFFYFIDSNLIVRGFRITGGSFDHKQNNNRFVTTQCPKSKLSFPLKDFGQDDLPNLFGINPIEATILFGTAYYIFGSDKLYEFAREAGRIFSTYFPIVRQALEDIVYEFRDFLEEDRERALLQKAGIDVSLLPRRTTNIIERLQKGLETMGEMTESVAKASATESTNGRDIIQSSELFVPVSDREEAKMELGDRRSKRKTKKEILMERKQREPLFSAKEEEDRPQLRSQTFSTDTKVIKESETLPEISSNPELSPNIDNLVTPAPSNLFSSKFQQQLSGEWNNKVLRREKYDVLPSPSPLLPFSSFEDWDDNDIEDRFYLPPQDDERTFKDIPEEISGDQQQLLDNSADTDTEVETANNDKQSVDLLLAETKELLKVVDEDYQKLRAKLIKYIATIESETVSAKK